MHFERWQHAYGYGKWFHAARHTVTLEVFGTYSAQVAEPRQDIRKEEHFGACCTEQKRRNWSRW